MFSLKKKLRRAVFRFQLGSGVFGWYDVYHCQSYQGTVLAFGSVHALEQTAKEDAYSRDDAGVAIAFNPAWRTEFSYAPGSARVREQTPAFRPAYLGAGV